MDEEEGKADEETKSEKPEIAKTFLHNSSAYCNEIPKQNNATNLKLWQRLIASLAALEIRERKQVDGKTKCQLAE